MKIGIDGMGRIGRKVVRIALEHDELEVVHVNDVKDAEFSRRCVDMMTRML